MKVKKFISLLLILVSLSACSGSTPTSVPIPDTKVESTTEAKVEPTTEIKVESTAETKVEPTAEAKVEPTTETKVEPTTEAKVEPTTEIKVEPTTEAKVEPTTEIKVESTAETKVEPTTEAEVEPTTEVKVEPTTEAKVEPTTEAKVEPTTETYVEPTTEAKVEPTTETKVEPTTEVKVEPTTEVKVEPTTEVYVEPTTEVYVEPTTEAYVEPTTETYVEPTTEAYVEPAIEITPEMLIEKIIANVPRKSRLEAAIEYYDVFDETSNMHNALDELCLIEDFNTKAYYLPSRAKKDRSNLINSFINSEMFKALTNNNIRTTSETVRALYLNGMYDDCNDYYYYSFSSDLYNDLDYIQNNYMYRGAAASELIGFLYKNPTIESWNYYYKDVDHILVKSASALILYASYISYDIYDSSNTQELYYDISSSSRVKNKTNTYEKELNNYNKVKDNIHLNYSDVSTSNIQDIYFLDKNPNGAILVLTIDCIDYKFYFTTFDKETNTGDLFYVTNLFTNSFGIKYEDNYKKPRIFATQEDKDLFNKECLVSTAAVDAFKNTGNDMFLNPDLTISEYCYSISGCGGASLNAEKIQYILDVAKEKGVGVRNAQLAWYKYKSAEDVGIDYVLVDGQVFITEFGDRSYWEIKELLGIDLNEYITIPEEVKGVQGPIIPARRPL